MTNIFTTAYNTVKHWYIPLIAGLLFIVAGLYIFTVPMETYLTLSLLFSLSFIVSGIMETYFAIQNNKTLSGWGWYLVSGLASIAFGIYLLSYPAVSIPILSYFVGFGLLFRNAYLLGIAFQIKSSGLKWGNLAITSILGILFSFLLIANPLFTGLSLVMLTALAFLFGGIAFVMLSFDLKKLKNLPDRISPELKSRIASLEKEIRERIAG